MPLFYANQSTINTDPQEDKVLEEFIVNCLLDPSFPQFVLKVQKVLTKVVAEELNPPNA
jgi:hypothetical protein